MGALRFVLARENKRRDRLQAADQNSGAIASNLTDRAALTDQTDKENLNFRYIL